MVFKTIFHLYEPGLNDMLAENVREDRITFTIDVDSAIKESEVIFIAVGTPPAEDGSADLKHVLDVAQTIGKNMSGYKVVVDKSTVPVDTGRKVAKVIQSELDNRGVDYNFDVVSNPEFLREGKAVYDFTHPDRIKALIEISFLSVLFKSSSKASESSLTPSNDLKL
jgi:UDPglucose 6-dehydrogenase